MASGDKKLAASKTSRSRKSVNVFAALKDGDFFHKCG
jgi:hypothetical protein